MNEVYIWGAGHFGALAALDMEKKGYHVTGFIDSDKELQGKRRLGYEVFAPEQIIKEMNAKQQKIVIATWFAVKEIADELKKHGYVSGRDFEVFEQIKESLDYQDVAGELDYLEMQKKHYNATKITPEQIVGNYDFHENFLYETLLLYENGDIRKPIFTDFKSKRAFDICCGEGRMIRRMNKLFGVVDGADISPKMINEAADKTPYSKLYVTNGNNCGDAESDFYDFAYCTISLQHICSYTIRDKIIKDVVRILNSKGKLSLQMIYSANGFYVPYTEMSSKDYFSRLYSSFNGYTSFFEDRYFVQSTNGACDVLITLDELDAIKEYFRNFFHEVSFWFWDISIGRGGLGKSRKLQHTHPNSCINDEYVATHFIFIHCAMPKK